MYGVTYLLSIDDEMKHFLLHLKVGSEDAFHVQDYVTIVIKNN